MQPTNSRTQRPSDEQQAGNHRPRWKSVARIVILLLVGWGILHTLRDAQDKIAAEDFSLSQVRWGWLPIAMLAYAAAMVPMAAFWHRVLHAMGQRPKWWETWVAYSVGQLGKYVPGKAMVVVLRSTLVRSESVDGAAAVISVFVETLSMMAIGAFTATGILLVVARHGLLLLLAIGLMLAAGVPVLPPVMRRILWVLRLRKLHIPVDDFLKGLTVRRLWPGWLGVALSWWLMGLSLWAVIQSLPGAPSLSASLGDWPLLTSCTALALVAGFVSLLPGGVLVREYIVMALLASQPAYGPLIAVVSAVLLRVSWLLTEAILAATGYPLLTSLRRRSKPRGTDRSNAPPRP